MARRTGSTGTGRSRSSASRRIERDVVFSECVAEGRGVDYRPWDERSGQIYLGSVAFQERMTSLIAEAKPRAEIPRLQRRPARSDLATVEREVLCAFRASPKRVGGAISTSGTKRFALCASSRHGRAARRHQFSNEAVVTAFGNELFAALRSSSRRIAAVAEVSSPRWRSDFVEADLDGSFIITSHET